VGEHRRAGVIATESFLEKLAVHERNAIHRGAEEVNLVAGEVLLHAQGPAQHAWFPVTAVVSMVRSLREDSALELALIGNEGVVMATHLDSFVVQSGGAAFRMPAVELTNQFRRAGGLQKYLLRFADALMAQVAQTAVCARFHAPEKRLARWLLMVNDRTGRDQIDASPLAIRTMLAITQDRVVDAVAKLVSSRVISLRQPVIKITDRDGLEASSCECYETMRQEYERLI
jgi:hypothetical protein